MNATKLPAHLLPVLRHLVVSPEGREPFQFRWQAEARVEELEARGVRAIRLRV